MKKDNKNSNKSGKGRKKNNYVTYPKGVKTFEQKKEYLEGLIDETLSKLNRLQCNSVEYAKELGLYLLEYKRVCKAKGEKWKKVRKYVFPALNERTYFRYTNIARTLKKVDLEKNEGIAVLGQTRIEGVYQMLKKSGMLKDGETIIDLFADNDLDFDIDVEDPEEVTELKAKVDKLLGIDKSKDDETPEDDENDDTEDETEGTNGDEDEEDEDDEDSDSDEESDEDEDDEDNDEDEDEEEDTKADPKSLRSALIDSTNKVTKTIDQILESKNQKIPLKKNDFKEFFAKVKALEAYIKALKK